MNLNQDFFALFGLPWGFRLDRATLDTAYRQIQGEVHPDRFASHSPAEQQRALQWATHANEAYQTLKSPLSRARYLLSLHGVDTAEQTNTAMPVDFLMAQMDWRDEMAAAQAGRDAEALEALSHTVCQEARALTQALAAQLDDEADYPAAAGLVRKLRFLDKFEQDIGDALEALLD